MNRIRAIDFCDRPRNPMWERVLSTWLRQQPENSRLEFLLELVNYQPVVSLLLASNTLDSRSSFVSLLHLAVERCDASEIKYWLRSIVPRLGFRRSIDILIGLIADHPEGVAKANYWMSQFATSDRDREKLRELQKAIGLQ